MLVAIGNNDLNVSMESLDNSIALPMTNQEKWEVLEILEDDRFDITIKWQEQRSFQWQPMFSTTKNNDSNVLMENIDKSMAFSIANL